jgi:hypothetical protein
MALCLQHFRSVKKDSGISFIPGGGYESSLRAKSFKTFQNLRFWKKKNTVDPLKLISS